MPLILPGNVATEIGGAYTVDNSCRFNDDDEAAMSKSSTTLTDEKKFTISAWCKRSTLGGSSQYPIFGHISDSNNANKNCQFGFYNDALYMAYVDGGSVTMNKVTTALYRDIGAWYHVMVAVDSTQGTAANRNRFYVNGTEVTSFSTDTNVGSDETFLATSCTITVGKYTNTSGTASYFDGYLAEVVYIDGLQLTPSSFGEFDEDSPRIWKPKDVSGLTFGNNGFYLDFEASDNLGNDANGGTDLSESNLAATDQCVDSPTNNFATLNPLQTNAFDSGSTTFSEGNTKYVNSGSASFNSMWLPTIGVTSGKWYGEFKLGSHSTSSGHSIGIYRTKSEPYLTGGDVPASDMVRIIFADTANVVIQFGSTVETSLGSCSSGDIFGLYFDADNGKLHCYKNGSAYITQITGMTIAGYTWYMHTQGEVQATRNLTFEHNYGNPSFSISSSNADPNGYGSFEYSTTENSVDYYALCTKNLAEFG